MGQSILFDTISSLCTENPYLNFIDSKTTITLNKNNISPEFKIFLTYNPSYLGKKTINQILFNSCARFSLTPFDINNKDSSIVIYNSLIEKVINNIILWKKICSKLALCHKINVLQSENNLDLMAGGIKFSPRHLIFLGKDGKNFSVSKKDNEISNWIKTIFQLYYFNSFNQNKDEIIKDIKKEVYN